MIEHIQTNARMVIQQLRPVSRIDFGYNQASVEWLEGHIEQLRKSGELADDATKRKLTSVFGSFLGECIVRCYGGSWTQQQGTWCIAFEGDHNFAFPFGKVKKQIENGLEDGIASFFRAIPEVFRGHVNPLPSASKTKPWWRLWS